MDFYNILEVDHYATNKEIKKSYRRLAKKYHPDKNDGTYDDIKIKNIKMQSIYFNKVLKSTH